MKVEDLVPEELWKEIEPLLPSPKPRRFRYPGRKPMDRRRALMGILYVLRSGIPWEMLPQELGCGSGMSCWRYLHRWQNDGVWQKIHEVLLARLRGADKIDFSRVVVDSSSVRAVLGGQKRGRTRRTAGKRGPNTTSSLKLRGFPLRSLSRRRTGTT
jgi:transposase